MTHDEMRDFARTCLGSADTAKSLLADCVLQLLAAPAAVRDSPQEGTYADKRGTYAEGQVVVSGGALAGFMDALGGESGALQIEIGEHEIQDLRISGQAYSLDGKYNFIYRWPAAVRDGAAQKEQDDEQSDLRGMLTRIDAGGSAIPEGATGLRSGGCAGDRLPDPGPPTVHLHDVGSRTSNGDSAQPNQAIVRDGAAPSLQGTMDLDLQHIESRLSTRYANILPKQTRWHIMRQDLRQLIVEVEHLRERLTKGVSLGTLIKVEQFGIEAGRRQAAQSSGIEATDGAAPSEQEWTEEEVAALRVDFEAFARKRNVPPEVFAIMCPWAVHRAHSETPDSNEAWSEARCEAWRQSEKPQCPHGENCACVIMTRHEWHVAFCEKTEEFQQLVKEVKAERAAQPSASEAGAAPSETPGWLKHIQQHLSAVEGSPDWADLAEILAWYRQDVAELLAHVAVHGSRASSETHEK